MSETHPDFIDVMRIWAKLEVEHTKRSLVLYSLMEQSRENEQGQSFEEMLPRVDWPSLQEEDK